MSSRATSSAAPRRPSRTGSHHGGGHRVGRRARSPAAPEPGPAPPSPVREVESSDASRRASKALRRRERTAHLRYVRRSRAARGSGRRPGSRPALVAAAAADAPVLAHRCAAAAGPSAASSAPSQQTTPKRRRARPLPGSRAAPGGGVALAHGAQGARAARTSPSAIRKPASFPHHAPSVEAGAAGAGRDQPGRRGSTVDGKALRARAPRVRSHGRIQPAALGTAAALPAVPSIGSERRRRQKCPRCRGHAQLAASTCRAVSARGSATRYTTPSGAQLKMRTRRARRAASGAGSDRSRRRPLRLPHASAEAFQKRRLDARRRLERERLRVHDAHHAAIAGDAARRRTRRRSRPRRAPDRVAHRARAPRRVPWRPRAAHRAYSTRQCRFRTAAASSGTPAQRELMSTVCRASRTGCTARPDARAGPGARSTAGAALESVCARAGGGHGGARLLDTDSVSSHDRPARRRRRRPSRRRRACADVSVGRGDGARIDAGATRARLAARARGRQRLSRARRPPRAWRAAAPHRVLCLARCASPSSRSSAASRS